MNLREELKKEYFDTRNDLNKYLDSKSMEFEEKIITKKQVLWTFMYGKLSHAEVKKEELIDEWMKRDHLRVYLPFEFCTILESVLGIISKAVEVNTKAIEELKQDQIDSQI